MAVTSSTLMRWRSKKPGPSAELPDYSIIFHHGVSSWGSVNEATHGTEPDFVYKPTMKFQRYPICKKRPIDVHDSQDPVDGEFYSVVRCVDSANNWPSKCDLLYSSNTSLTPLDQIYLDVGGRHKIIGMLGRPQPSNPVSLGIPRLRSEQPDNRATGSLIDIVSKYTADHIGHTHRVAVDGDILNATPTESSDPSENLKFFPSLALAALFKKPILNSEPITTFPKDTVVFYYGGGTLSSTYFDPVYSHPKADKNIPGLTLPISLMEAENDGCKHTGIQNYSSSLGLKKMKITASSSSDGAHDHVLPATLAGIKYASLKTGTSDVVTGTGSSSVNEQVLHAHSVDVVVNVELKSKTLKAYITKNTSAPIVKGIIIGYSLGKFSGFNGEASSGADMLPLGWHFCDGQNDTPDLRGYYPFANFTNSDTGTVIHSSNRAKITEVNVETIDWHHNHVSKSFSFNGNPGYADQGSHTTTYDPSATRHNHEVSALDEFVIRLTGQTTGTRYFNLKKEEYFNYTPPTVDVAFIMYNPDA